MMPRCYILFPVKFFLTPIKNFYMFTKQNDVPVTSKTVSVKWVCFMLACLESAENNVQAPCPNVKNFEIKTVCASLVCV